VWMRRNGWKWDVKRDGSRKNFFKAQNFEFSDRLSESRSGERLGWTKWRVKSALPKSGVHRISYAVTLEGCWGYLSSVWPLLRKPQCGLSAVSGWINTWWMQRMLYATKIEIPSRTGPG
jgi:hypothetical protein